MTMSSDVQLIHGEAFAELAKLPSGSLYFFCDEKRQAYVQVELDKHFSLINSLVWEKPSSIGKNSPLSRSFTITTERILFYEQAAAPGLPKTGLEEIHSRPDCFTSLKAYMRVEMDEEYCRRAQAWLDSAEMPQKRARKSRKDNLPTDGEQLLLGLF